MEIYNLTGFMDANQFTIMDGIPYYNKTGNSYMETFRAGLSLENVTEFNLYMDVGSDHAIPVTDDKPVSDNKPAFPAKHIYDVPDISDADFTKKHKNTHNSRPNVSTTISLNKSKKIHKKKVRNAGNDWKLFKIEQEQGERIDIGTLTFPIGSVKLPAGYSSYIDNWEDTFIPGYRTLDDFYDEYYYDDEEYYNNYEEYIREIEEENNVLIRMDRAVSRNN